MMMMAIVRLLMVVCVSSVLVAVCVSAQPGSDVLDQAASWLNQGIVYKYGGDCDSPDDCSGGIDCSHYVWRVFGGAGYTYDYTTTKQFPPSQFSKVDDGPQSADIVLFKTHMGIVSDDTSSFYGSQSSTGPGLTKISYLGTPLGYYRWNQ